MKYKSIKYFRDREKTELEAEKRKQNIDGRSKLGLLTEQRLHIGRQWREPTHECLDSGVGMEPYISPGHG